VERVCRQNSYPAMRLNAKMPDISFIFNIEKLVQTIAFFSSKGVRDLTKLKVAKMIYFADKAHLLRYGRPIIGDVYYCLQYGPVPSVSLNEMSDALSAPEAACTVDARQDTSLFHSVLKIRKPLWSHPHFEAKGGYARGVFSESEVEALSLVVNEYGSCSAGQLIDLTHKEPTWLIPNENRSPYGRAPIPYELFFEGASQTEKQVLSFLKEEQEEKSEFDSIFAVR
jgi:uncharacterized phage-associated protein